MRTKQGLNCRYRPRLLGPNSRPLMVMDDDGWTPSRAAVQQGAGADVQCVRARTPGRLGLSLLAPIQARTSASSRRAGAMSIDRDVVRGGGRDGRMGTATMLPPHACYFYFACGRRGSEEEQQYQCNATAARHAWGRPLARAWIGTCMLPSFITTPRPVHA